MKWIAALLALLIGATLPTGVEAEPRQKAGDLSEKCEITGYADLSAPVPSNKIVKMAAGGSECLGFLSGFLGGYTFATRSTPDSQMDICFPSGVTPGQLARILVTAMRRHPEREHEPSIDFAIYAFSSAFPCRNRYDRP